MHEMVSFGLLFLRSKVIFLMFPLFHMGGRLGGNKKMPQRHQDTMIHKD